MRKLGRRGALQVPLLLATLVITVAGFGTWGVLRHWRKLVETQLRLDRCTARAALQLRDTLESILAANRRIVTLRIAMEAAAAVPEAQAPLLAALHFQVGKQEFQRARWVVLQTRWLSRTYCENFRDFPQPLPELSWVRDPPDLLGPQPLRWPGVMPTRFQIQIGHSPRHAAARVERSLNAEGDTNGKWQAQWTAPSL